MHGVRQTVLSPCSRTVQNNEHTLQRPTDNLHFYTSFRIKTPGPANISWLLIQTSLECFMPQINNPETRKFYTNLSVDTYRH